MNPSFEFRKSPPIERDEIRASKARALVPGTMRKIKRRSFESLIESRILVLLGDFWVGIKFQKYLNGALLDGICIKS